MKSIDKKKHNLRIIEKEEQKILRRKYIDSVVGSLKNQLDNTKVVHPDGRVESLKKDK